MWRAFCSEKPIPFQHLGYNYICHSITKNIQRRFLSVAAPGITKNIQRRFLSVATLGITKNIQRRFLSVAALGITKNIQRRFFSVANLGSYKSEERDNSWRQRVGETELTTSWISDQEVTLSRNFKEVSEREFQNKDIKYLALVKFWFQI